MKERKFDFEKIILWSCMVFAVLFFLFVMIDYTAQNKILFNIYTHSHKINDVGFYTGKSDTKDIIQITDASDSDFSTVKANMKERTATVWLRLKTDKSMMQDDTILFANANIIMIGQAYVYSNGVLQNIENKENCIYSYIELPSDMDRDSYIYLKLENMDSNINFSIHLSNEEDFYRSQNINFLWNMASLGVLFAMLIMNVVLYLISKEKKHMIHSLFLFTLTNMLFQTSGIAKITFGFNNINYSYIWTFITIVSTMLFAYDYFDIHKQLSQIVKYFLAFLILSFSFLMVVYGFQFQFFSMAFLSFVILICVSGLLVSAYTFVHAGKQSRLYIVAIGFYILSFVIFAMEYYGAIEWKNYSMKLLSSASAGEAVMFTIGILHNIKRENNKLKKIAIESARDQLTGLFNRNYFEKKVIPKVQKALQNQEIVSLLMLDIDHFKEVNDTFGHNAGDVLLKEIASRIVAIVKNQDVAIRWGGEEFIIILFQTNINIATMVAERVRADIEKYDFSCVPEAQGINQVTVSIGVAEKNTEEDISEWIKRADKALYRAKRISRNCIQISYDVMSLKKINWEPLLECKNVQINHDHKKLLNLVNKLIEEFYGDNKEKVFETVYDQILEETTRHFDKEEKILITTLYPLLENHKLIHQAIVDEALEVRKSLADHENGHAEVIEFLAGRVVMGHMLSEDTKFFDYL